MKKLFTGVAGAVLAVVMSGCIGMGPSRPLASESGPERYFTWENVGRLYVGMSGGDVEKLLGYPSYKMTLSDGEQWSWHYSGDGKNNQFSIGVSGGRVASVPSAVSQLGGEDSKSFDRGKRLGEAAKFLSANPDLDADLRDSLVAGRMSGWDASYAHKARRRRSAYIAQHPELDAKTKDLISKGKYEIGMKSAEFVASFGEPVKKNITVTAGGTHEQWVYGDTLLYYFENALLTSYQVSIEGR